jgi:hypothetical protein
LPTTWPPQRSEGQEGGKRGTDLSDELVEEIHSLSGPFKVFQLSDRHVLRELQSGGGGGGQGAEGRGGYVVEVVSLESAGERVGCDSLSGGFQELQSSIAFVVSSLLCSHHDADMVPLRPGDPPLEMGERVGALEENDVTPLRFWPQLRDVDRVPWNSFRDVHRIEPGGVDGPQEGQDWGEGREGGGGVKRRRNGRAGVGGWGEGTVVIGQSLFDGDESVDVAGELDPSLVDCGGEQRARLKFLSREIRKEVARDESHLVLWLREKSFVEFGEILARRWGTGEGTEEGREGGRRVAETWVSMLNRPLELALDDNHAVDGVVLAIHVRGSPCLLKQDTNIWRWHLVSVSENKGKELRGRERCVRVIILVMSSLVKGQEEIRDGDMIVIMDPIGVEIKILWVITRDEHETVTTLDRREELLKFVEIREEEEDSQRSVIPRKGRVRLEQISPRLEGVTRDVKRDALLVRGGRLGVRERARRGGMGWFIRKIRWGTGRGKNRRGEKGLEGLVD